MEELTKEYTKGSTAVVWKAHLCQHSGICAKGLPRVFNPRRKPWIDMDASELEKIKSQVAMCPSGALTVRDVPSDQPGT